MGPATRVELAPTTQWPAIADPAALGLAGFAMTTFVLSVFNAQIITTPALLLVVLPLALFYGGIAQLLAGMWEFRRGNTFASTAFVSYGAFWLAYAAYVRFVAPGLPAAVTYQATGLFLMAWGIFTTYMLIASLRTNLAIVGVFFTLMVTFWLLCIGALEQSTNWTKAGGIAGLVTAAVAWYASFAIVTNATWKRTILPVWPTNVGR